MPIIRAKNRIKLTLQDTSWDCAVAAIRMYLSYFGYNFTKTKITRETGTTKEGTDVEKIIQFFKTLGEFDVLEYEDNLNQAKQYLKENIPLFICYDMLGNPDYSHYAVVVGWERGKIIVFNPNTDTKEQVREEYAWRWFKYWWKAYNFWFIVLKRKK